MAALASGPVDWVRGRINLDLGRVADLRGQRAEAIAHYRTARDIGQQANDPVSVADALSSCAARLRCRRPAARSLRPPGGRSCYKEQVAGTWRRGRRGSGCSWAWPDWASSRCGSGRQRRLLRQPSRAVRPRLSRPTRIPGFQSVLASLGSARPLYELDAWNEPRLIAALRPDPLGRFASGHALDAGLGSGSGAPGAGLAAVLAAAFRQPQGPADARRQRASTSSG